MKSDQTHADVQNPKSADSTRDPRSADASSPSDQSRNPPWIGTGIYIGLRRGQERTAS
ncbi:hypothetical protein [Azospirillum aestuarii]|uniref:hypothetical protein n=1 Tax=Azospirillum aestuarii TaxID=2802052 RepID=UPI004054D8D6